jgi:hypothetical protein
VSALEEGGMLIGNILISTATQNVCILEEIYSNNYVGEHQGETSDIFQSGKSEVITTQWFKGEFCQD